MVYFGVVWIDCSANDPLRQRDAAAVLAQGWHCISMLPAFHAPSLLPGRRAGYGESPSHCGAARCNCEVDAEMNEMNGNACWLLYTFCTGFACMSAQLFMRA